MTTQPEASTPKKEKTIMTNEQVRELEKQNAELSVWGLKKAVLSKRQEVVDLELQVRQAEDVLKRFRKDC